MLREERFTYIMNKLKNEHKIHLLSLSEELNVSDDTIRRDLNELDAKGIITKVRGGAIPKSGIPINFNDRIQLTNVEKIRMAQKVIHLFEAGQIVMIDGGTTNLALAQQLPKDIDLTIFTNSFPIVYALKNHFNIKLNFLGGTVFQQANVTIGSETLELIKTVRPDWLVLGVSNIHYQFGVTVPHHNESIVKRQMVAQAKNVMVLADKAKLNTAEHYQVCQIQDLEVLVIDDGMTQKQIEPFMKQNLKII